MAVTPNGYADGVAQVFCEKHGIENCFVMPEELVMTFSSFLQHLEQQQ